MEYLRGDDVNRRALLLSSVMLRGHGVSVVAAEIQNRISACGWDLIVGALEIDQDFRSPSVVQLDANPVAIAAFAQANHVEAIIAQTSPYFEVLPALQRAFPTIVFEHGDPTPAFFEVDGAEREAIRQRKIKHVYPEVSKVICSSHFLRHDIGWPQASVVYLAADHVPDLGPKCAEMTVFKQPSELKVGTLIRLGEGEARYKGNEMFRNLARTIQNQCQASFCVMGKGTEKDAEPWIADGFAVHLNASDEERANYLRELDVFISPSQWEGFNLPVLEAASLGTFSMAFDVGAHPETAPFLAGSVDEAANLLSMMASDRSLLHDLSRKSYRYARTKFSWMSTSISLARILNETVGQPTHIQSAVTISAPTSKGQSNRASRLIRLLKREGIVGGARRIIRRVAGKS